jgi:hypothetical protein
MTRVVAAEAVRISHNVAKKENDGETTQRRRFAVVAYLAAASSWRQQPRRVQLSPDSNLQRKKQVVSMTRIWYDGIPCSLDFGGHMVP